MSDQRIRDLLHEVADGVEPGDRLEAIRAATADGRRTRRGWWAAGGVSLVAAAVVTAVVLTTGNAPTGAPDPVAPVSTPTSDPPTTTPSLEERMEKLEEMRELSERVTAIYYVGDTWAGQRLYREFRTGLGADPLGAATAGLATAPDDPDYVNLWPADAILDVSFDGVGDDGQIGVSVDRTYAGRPASMTPDQASLAVEQVVRTLQAAVKARAPVQFYADGNPISQVLGVPTSEALSTAPDLDVLAHVNISDPFEEQVVDNDEPFVVRGVGTGYEGNIVTRIQRWEGTYVVDEIPTIASGETLDRLWPFEVTFDLTDVPPGDYVVTSRTEDPTGAGNEYEDSRRITIVD